MVTHVYIILGTSSVVAAVCGLDGTVLLIFLVMDLYSPRWLLNCSIYSGQCTLQFSVTTEQFEVFSVQYTV